MKLIERRRRRRRSRYRFHDASYESLRRRFVISINTKF